MSDQDSDNKDEQETIEFHYLKGNDFRVIHVDGTYGGLSPDGKINMSVYNQRHPIPKKVVHEIEGTKLGEEIEEERDTKKGIIREIEANITMDVETAEALRDWIDEKIQQAKQAGLIDQEDQSVTEEPKQNDADH